MREVPIAFPSPRFNKANVDKWLEENVPAGWEARYIAPVKQFSRVAKGQKKPAPSPTPDTRYDIWPAPEATDEEIAAFRVVAERMMRKLPSDI